MPKNIALFVDGTGNDGPRDLRIKNDQQTNVYRLFQLCDEKEKLYLAGVGSKSGDVLGGAAGFGTKKRLRLAYNFLAEKYNAGDSIFLFGFSRGALAVRLLADFLGYAGTFFVKPPFDKYLPHVYQIYESTVVLDNLGHFETYIQLFDRDITALPVRFIGVWDTVERYFPERRLPYIEKLASHIDHARQALAIHERRNEMAPRLWAEWTERQIGGVTLPTVQQVWFPGAHADVGGGYPQSKLSEAPLAWILSEAKKLGLNVRGAKPASLPQIIHQQRTKNAFVGTFAKLFDGEETRAALSPGNTKVRATMDFNGTAENHLNGTTPIKRVDLKKYPPFSDGLVKTKLTDVDKTAGLLLKDVRLLKKRSIS